jgi:hypothetical protein
MTTLEILRLATEGKAPNQCQECFSFSFSDQASISHTEHCARRSHRVYDSREDRADLFLRQENAGITDYWYEG